MFLITLSLDCTKLDVPNSLVAAHWTNDIEFSEMCQKSLQWIMYSQAQEYAVVIPTNYKELLGWADCLDRII
jgi:hypothetical protein